VGIKVIRQETDGLDEEDLIARAADLVAQDLGNVAFPYYVMPALRPGGWGAK